MGIYNLGGGGGAPELQAKEATPLITNAQQIILPDEGYDGLSRVTVNPMPTGALKTPTVNSIGYVSSGVQTAGYFDTSATSGLQLSTQAAQTITPTTYSQTAVASGKYTTGAVTVAGDANLVAGNIKSGVNIFGVAGSLESGIATFVKASSSGSGTQSITFTASRPSSLNSPYIKLTSFSISVNWSGSLSNGDIFRGYFVADLTSVSYALFPIKSNNTETEFLGMMTGKGYDDQVYGKFNYGTLRADSSNIYFTIRCQDSQFKWASNGTYSISMWFNNSYE